MNIVEQFTQKVLQLCEILSEMLFDFSDIPHLMQTLGRNKRNNVCDIYRFSELLYWFCNGYPYFTLYTKGRSLASRYSIQVFQRKLVMTRSFSRSSYLQVLLEIDTETFFFYFELNRHFGIFLF